MVSGRAWVRSSIDGFILQNLEANGLSPAPEAERRVLIRRLTFDLTGLPPAAEDVDAFIHDRSPDAYEHLVERYLASPQYGVRWARWWLDLRGTVRATASNTTSIAPTRGGIATGWSMPSTMTSLTMNLPGFSSPVMCFARMTRGPSRRPDFWSRAPYDTAGQNQQSVAMKAVVRGDELEDIIGTVGQTFLGLTLNCARCHDHKFDPVRQVEYYRLASALGGVRHGERDLTDVDKSAIAKRKRKAYVVVPRPAGVTHVEIRGNPNQPGDVVTAGGISSVTGVSPDFGLRPDTPEEERRTRLAAWVSNARNPLFSRVLVNRLWQAHFGTGLVETPSDLGFNGGKPSHPELLDWLASELVDRGFSLKAMHRLIVNSAAYRQSSRSSPAGLRIDAGNRLLWRKAPARLEAEMVRDAMLAVSGRIDLSLGGPSFHDQEIVPSPGTRAVLYAAVDPATARARPAHALSVTGLEAAGARFSTYSTAPIRRRRPRAGPSRPRRSRRFRF